MARLVATFAAILLGCDCRLIVRPENTAVLYGTEVTMKCSTNSSQKLLWRTDCKRSEGCRTIYTGNQFVNKLPEFYDIVTNNDGKFDLITRANEVTARTYTCEEWSDNASAELIALVSDPVCTDWNEKNDIKAAMNLPLKLHCHIRYWGNWAPVMEWKRLDGDGKPFTSIEDGVSSKTDNNSVYSILTVTAGQSLNSTRYSCVTKFTESNRPRNTTAINTPEYSYTWKYPAEGTTGENVTVKLVAIFLVVFLVVVSGLVGYIVYMKRKQSKDEHVHLALDTLSSVPRRTSRVESDYTEAGRSSVGRDGHCGEEYYTGLDDQAVAQSNVYVALEKKLQY